MISPEQATQLFETSECLYTQAQVEKALDAMAADITLRLSTENPLLIAVLKGGMAAELR